ncbi:hypothetical protein TYRP_010044 [Tyrophagus putrescentiae]|nr:hypothetical protein TYRP_010044 [Tyrophagus putrescentiae]
MNLPRSPNAGHNSALVCLLQPSDSASAAALAHANNSLAHPPAAALADCATRLVFRYTPFHHIWPICLLAFCCRCPASYKEVPENMNS